MNRILLPLLPVVAMAIVPIIPNGRAVNTLTVPSSALPSTIGGDKTFTGNVTFSLATHHAGGLYTDFIVSQDTNPVAIVGENGAGGPAVQIRSSPQLTSGDALQIYNDNGSTLVDEFDFQGKLKTYGGTATVANGVCAIVAHHLTIGIATSQNITTFTPSSNGIYMIGGFVRPTAHTSGNIGLIANWTDDLNASFSEAMFGGDYNGGTTTDAIGGTSTDQLRVFPMTISAKASVAINLNAFFAGTATADFDAWICRLN